MAQHGPVPQCSQYRWGQRPPGLMSSGPLAAFEGTSLAVWSSRQCSGCRNGGVVKEGECRVSRLWAGRRGRQPVNERKKGRGGRESWINLTKLPQK